VAFLTIATAALIGFIPVGFFIASKIYPQYAPGILGWAVCAVISFSILAASLWFYFKRRNYLGSIGLYAFIVPFLLFFGLSSHQRFENFVSSKGASDYLLQYQNVHGPVLCSKFFARGVKWTLTAKVSSARILFLT
jgi:hypothetical protein